MNSCGYTPMYSSVNKTDFYLEKINLNGDEFIINNITKNLKISAKQTVIKTLLLREKFYTKKLLRQKTWQEILLNIGSKQPQI